METFKDVIEKLRKENNDSLRSLAAKLEISAAFLSDLEKGKTIPLSYADKITKIYNLDNKSKNKLIDSINYSNNKILFDFNNYNDKQIELLLSLYRNIDNLNGKSIELINNILGEKNE